MASDLSKTNEELIARFADEVFVNKNLSGLNKYMHQNYIQHNPLVDQGLDGFKRFFQSWFSSVPDFNYTLKKIISDKFDVWRVETWFF